MHARAVEALAREGGDQGRVDVDGASFELAAQLEDMEREQGDVEEAIAQLRQGISGLNREGRKRLLEAFETVNAHFNELRIGLNDIVVNNGIFGIQIYAVACYLSPLRGEVVPVEISEMMVVIV